VRVDGALSKPAGIGQLAGLGLEYLDKLPADNLALGFGVGNTGQLAHEGIGGIYMNDLDAEVIRKSSHDLLRLVKAQQAVIDEYAGQLIADGFMNQCGGHG